MANVRRVTHADTSVRGGQVKIKLLSGRRLVASIPGPPPSYLTIDVPPENLPPGMNPEPGAKVVCKRIDIRRYREMTRKEMRKEGILREDPFNPDGC